jgi:hypothetical protein
VQTVLSPYDHITIFDGAFSEAVTVTLAALPGTLTVSCTPLQFDHGAGTPLCSDGIMGSLANVIVSAGTYLESICRQSLFLTTYINELLAMPTMRSSIDNHGVLHFRPRHWPINTLTALSVSSAPGSATPYNPVNVLIDSDKQICSLASYQPLSQSYPGYAAGRMVNRNEVAQLAITYTAGYSSIPPDVMEAAVLLTSDILAKRLNPLGAADLSSGGRSISAVLRGDNSGDSLLYKRALSILNSYTVESF